jgi:AAA domain
MNTSPDVPEPNTEAAKLESIPPLEAIFQPPTATCEEFLHSPGAPSPKTAASELDSPVTASSPGEERPLPDTVAASPQQQIADAVQRKFKAWREAKGKGYEFVGVAEEVEVRRILQQVEAAERGLSPSSVEPQPVQTLEGFFERSFPQKEPLIERLLFPRDIVAFAGRRRHGKTTFISNLVLALVLCLSDFLGYSIPAPARVLCFYLEDDAGELQAKLKRMAGDRLSPESRERLALYVREDFYRAAIPIDATNPQFHRFVFNKCAAHKPDIIIFDNLSQLIGADHNNSKLIHQLMQLMWQITKEFNAAVRHYHSGPRSPERLLHRNCRR